MSALNLAGDLDIIAEALAITFFWAAARRIIAELTGLRRLDAATENLRGFQIPFADQKGKPNL